MGGLQLPESEQICKKQDYPYCQGCDKITFGWDKTKHFYCEENIFTYKNIFLPETQIRDRNFGRAIGKNLRYDNLFVLMMRAKEIMDGYLGLKTHKLFKDLPPVKVSAVTENPTITIKESGIMVSFLVKPIGFNFKHYEEYGLAFYVAFIHDFTNNDFKLVAQHNHH